MRFPGTWKQYSKNAIPQLASTTTHIADRFSAGEVTRPHRHTGIVRYHVMQGEGACVLDQDESKALEWEDHEAAWHLLGFEEETTKAANDLQRKLDEVRLAAAERTPK